MAEGGCNIIPQEAITSSTQTSLTNMRDITICPRCQHLLQAPKTLKCLHSFCSKCLDGIGKSEIDGATGYECPQCQRFSLEPEVREFPLLSHLLQQLTNSKKSAGAKCEVCSVKDAKWFCPECRKVNWHCDTCKPFHDTYFQDHKMLSLDEMRKANVEVDKPVYCLEHPKNELELYCIQCEKIMCLRCRFSEHDGHKTEPIAEALGRLTPNLNACLDKMNTKIKENRDAISTLEKEKEEAIERYNKQIRKKENEVCEQSEIVAWVNTVCGKTKDALKLQFLQDGLLDKIDYEWLDGSFHASRCLPWVARNSTPKLFKTIDLPPDDGPSHPFTRIAILWDRIWMVNQNSRRVYKYTFDGNEDGNFELDKKIMKPRTVMQVASHAIVAAKSGLYSIDRGGNFICCIQEGDFSDVCLGRKSGVFGLEYMLGCIYHFKMVNGAWVHCEKITLEKYGQYNVSSRQNYVNTFVMKNNAIFVGIVQKHFILKYDINGGNVEVVADTTSGLRFPSIGGMTKDKHILVLNRDGRDRLDMISPTGNVNKLLDIHRPWFAVYQKETTLWCLHDEKLKKFVFE